MYIIITWTMNPPHYLMWKCQKLSSLPSLWILILDVTLKKATNNESLHIKCLPLLKNWHLKTCSNVPCADIYFQAQWWGSVWEPKWTWCLAYWTCTPKSFGLNVLHCKRNRSQLQSKNHINESNYWCSYSMLRWLVV